MNELRKSTTSSTRAVGGSRWTLSRRGRVPRSALVSRSDTTIGACALSGKRTTTGWNVALTAALAAATSSERARAGPPLTA